MRGDSLRILFRGSYFAGLVMLAQHFARGGPSDVHRDIAAADDQHSLPDGEFVAEVYVEQKLDAAMHAVQINTRYRQVAAAMCANRDQHCIEALPPQLANGEVASRCKVQAQRDVAGFEDLAYLGFDHTSRQAILRDSEVQHSARNRRRFEDGDRVAHQRQIVCCREANWSASDDGDLVGKFFGNTGARGNRMTRLRAMPLGEKTL